MKQLLIISLLISAGYVHAGEQQTQPSQSTLAAQNKQQQSSTAAADASNNGNAQIIVFEASSGTQTIRNVPSVGGPPLVSSNDTCMGSSSGSINAPGIGIGMGTTWVDENCRMLKNSRELWNMGMRAAALALMCTDARNREALELTGFVCPQTERARQQPVAVQQQPTDPFVRARLGLPPLE